MATFGSNGKVGDRGVEAGRGGTVDGGRVVLWSSSKDSSQEEDASGGVLSDPTLGTASLLTHVRWAEMEASRLRRSIAALDADIAQTTAEREKLETHLHSSPPLHPALSTSPTPTSPPTTTHLSLVPASTPSGPASLKAALKEALQQEAQNSRTIAHLRDSIAYYKSAHASPWGGAKRRVKDIERREEEVGVERVAEEKRLWSADKVRVRVVKAGEEGFGVDGKREGGIAGEEEVERELDRVPEEEILVEESLRLERKVRELKADIARANHTVLRLREQVAAQRRRNQGGGEE